tara:strand:+ start:789 stop:1547 length:759 start_codon:yes stop_codon:yes gene_type:complete
LQISKKINKLDFIDRHCSFEIPSFLDEAIYKDLSTTYPDPSLFSAHTEFAKGLTGESDNFSNFLEKNENWQNFIKELNTKVFVEDLIKLFDLKNVYFSKNSWKKNIPTFKRVKLSFRFNISEEGGFSLPHTDGTRKLASMVLFFVDKKWSKKNGGQVVLYKPNDPTYENNWRNEIVDKVNLEVIRTIIPSPNKIYGFKKTKNSYHSVEPIKGINFLTRKVLMINLIYENKSDSPYYQKISFLEKIKKMINIS